MQSLSISIVIHTYNASMHLDRVLESVKGFDEVIVADMESTDDTVDIARRHGARVIVYPKKNFTIPEIYREKAIHAASCPWVLVVDADELVTPQLREYLYDDIRRNNSPHGLRIPRKNFFMGCWMKAYYPDYILRFMPRDGTKWAPRIHSQPEVDAPVFTIPKKRTDLAFIHLANEKIGVYLNKINRYTDNEMDRRRNRYKAWKLLSDPPVRFFKSFFLKGGFRQGVPGFIHAMMDAFYRFILLAKLEEERREKKPSEIHKYLK
ncbi:MAG: glycosyltransferase family 2 protein [Muribaculum sp.]|nr:glycosyltransferase family 2 protein [Muribaculum sp.]